MFSKKSAPSKLLAPHGELIFDGFWWDFAKQGINLASKSTPKYAKSNRREAIRFDSRTAKVGSALLFVMIIVIYQKSVLGIFRYAFDKVLDLIRKIVIFFCEIL